MIADRIVPNDVPADVAFVECDVRDLKSFRNAFVATKEKFGGVDVVVNNAGVLKEARYEGDVNFPLPLAPSRNLKHQQN
jgi:NAD(P)-dependent dehydrogenase (short-subunit alcohol dehydrogenase family)